MYLNLRV